MKICLIDSQLFYEYFVRQSVGQATKIIDVIFSSTIYNRVLILFVKIYIMNEHLFWRYFVCVSGGWATKDLNVKVFTSC